MNALGYYNGTWGPLDEMTVPMNDRASYFGDGVYEAACAHNGVIFTLAEHLDRLWRSAGKLRINLRWTKEEMAAILYEMLARLDAADVLLYWQVTRGTAPRNHAFPGDDVPANLWITLKPITPPDRNARLRLITTEDTRFLHCDIKTLNLLPNVMASQRAAEAGCDECVFHRGEIVTECAHSNVSILKNGVFMTHPTDRYILPGITRALLLDACHTVGIPTVEHPFKLGELFAADEIIVSSTTQGGRLACEIDGKPVGGRAEALFAQIQDEYWARFARETTK